MALSKLLLLQALFFSLLLLMLPSHCNVYPAPTRPAISQATRPTDLSGFTCNKSDKDTTEPCQFSSEVIEWPSSVGRGALHRGWLAHAIVGIVLGIVFVLVSSFIRSAEDSVPQDEENFLGPSNAAGPPFPVMENVFTFNDLKRITKNFSNPIGQGGFGSVFRGQSSKYGQVAVKKPFTPLRQDLENAFNAELTTLSRTRHQNVVGLIGFCTENNERILVYEFISRKDLYGHLHPAKNQKQKSKNFSWKLRVKVLLGAARGIEYLHKNAEPRIIQRDIKSQNILIDENWVAKISDFGLAVFGPAQGINYVELEVPSGTVGYRDPECNDMNKRATPRNDVYSFGMVMLEVVTGEDVLIESLHLINSTVRSIHTGCMEEVLDKRLAVPVGREMEAITMVAQLATQCVKVPGIDRPDMTAVVTKLEVALALFDP